METVLVSIICIALVVFGGMTMSHGFMTSVDASTAGLSAIGDQTETLLRTELAPVSTNLTLTEGPSPLEVVMENTGQTRMADFAKWDVIVQYTDSSGDYQAVWLPYSADGAGVNKWGVDWIRLNGQPETIEPGVFNPGEQMMIKVWLDPAVGVNTTNMIVVSTPSGITSSTFFSPQ